MASGVETARARAGRHTDRQDLRRATLPSAWRRPQSCRGAARSGHPWPGWLRRRPRLIASRRDPIRVGDTAVGDSARRGAARAGCTPGEETVPDRDSRPLDSVVRPRHRAQNAQLDAVPACLLAARNLGLGVRGSLCSRRRCEPATLSAAPARRRDRKDRQQRLQVRHPPPLWAADPIAFATDPALGSKERHLLITLARYCNREGVCWPGIRRLASDTGMATDTVERATEGLVTKGRITVKCRGRGNSKLYRLREKPERRPASRTKTGGTSVLHARTPKEGGAA